MEFLISLTLVVSFFVFLSKVSSKHDLLELQTYVYVYVDYVYKPEVYHDYVHVKSTKDWYKVLDSRKKIKVVKLGTSIGKQHELGWTVVNSLIDKDIRQAGKYIVNDFIFKTTSSGTLSSVNPFRTMTNYLKHKERASW